MKKISLLMIACFAVAASAMAVEWPETFLFTGPGIFGNTNPSIPDDYERATATAVFLSSGVFTIPESEEAFDEVYYNVLGTGDGYQLTKEREDAGSPLDNDGVGAYKVGYDSEAIYVFLTYEHKDKTESLNKDFKSEIMFCPYDKLEYSGLADNEGVLYLRYLVLGGVKVDMNNDNSSGTFKLDRYMGVINADDENKGFMQEEGLIAGSYYEPYVSLVDCGTEKAIKIMLKLKYQALDYRLDPSNPVPFTIDTWKNACDNEGITFEVKLTLDNTGTDKRSYLWNHESNNSYFSNAYAGYLKLGEAGEDDPCILNPELPKCNCEDWDEEKEVCNDVGIQDGAFAANLSVQGDLIVLEEAGDVKIFNAAGMLIISQVNVSFVSIAGLDSGVYFAVSGNERVSFVK